MSGNVCGNKQVTDVRLRLSPHLFDRKKEKKIVLSPLLLTHMREVAFAHTQPHAHPGNGMQDREAETPTAMSSTLLILVSIWTPNSMHEMNMRKDLRIANNLSLMKAALTVPLCLFNTCSAAINAPVIQVGVRFMQINGTEVKAHLSAYVPCGNNYGSEKIVQQQQLLENYSHFLVLLFFVLLIVFNERKKKVCLKTE